MKRISLCVAAILLAGATVFANGSVTKAPAKKVKQECKCSKDPKACDCKDQSKCADMSACTGK